ncbi:MAG TPA: HAD family hydrolase [Methanocellaceae archaeon]|jgi:putative hydrolase of the HAD superfamily
MAIKAVISDIYTTLIDIKTDESNPDIYSRLASYLKYQGVYLSADELKWFFFEKKAMQKKASTEEYPEVDYRSIWQDILHENLYRPSGERSDGSAFVPDIIRLHRSLSVEKIKLYRGVFETLDRLKQRYRLGIVSDSQPDHAYPELQMLGIHGFFNAIIVSAEHGYRKPDVRLFEECLGRLGVTPSESVYLGNDTFRDVKGAKDAGMKAVLIMTKYGQKSGNATPDFIIDKIEEIDDVLKGMDEK